MMKTSPLSHLQNLQNITNFSHPIKAVINYKNHRNQFLSFLMSVNVSCLLNFSEIKEILKISVLAKWNLTVIKRITV